MIHYNIEQVYPKLCTVIQLPAQGFVYPIFKNASSSLQELAVATHIVNKNFNNTTQNLTVYWRKAQKRYNSGVNTYLQQNNNLDEDTLVSLIERGEIINRHFMPQYMWLCHLYKHYTGLINIQSLNNLNINVHKNASTRYYDFITQTHWIDLDDIIFNHFANTTTSLTEINKYIEDKHKVLYKKCIAQE